MSRGPWVVCAVAAAGVLLGGCAKQCEVTCATAGVNTCTPTLTLSTETVDLGDVSSDGAGRSQCQDEAAARNTGLTACWGYYE